MIKTCDQKPSFLNIFGLSKERPYLVLVLNLTLSQISSDLWIYGFWQIFGFNYDLRISKDHLAHKGQLFLLSRVGGGRAFAVPPDPQLHTFTCLIQGTRAVSHRIHSTRTIQCGYQRLMYLIIWFSSFCVPILNLYLTLINMLMLPSKGSRPLLCFETI